MYFRRECVVGREICVVGREICVGIESCEIWWEKGKNNASVMRVLCRYCLTKASILGETVNVLAYTLVASIPLINFFHTGCMGQDD